MPRPLAPVCLAAFALAAGQGPADAQITTRLVVAGLSAPLGFVQDPSDRTVQYIVEQAGRIRVLRGGVLQPNDFLNITTGIASGGERGLLGLAFPPDYATSGRFYVNFTNLLGDTVIGRYRRSATPLVADSTSGIPLRWGPEELPHIDQPFANHNGGHLAFGPDGYLYIGMGDGGSGNDPLRRAQDPSSRLGKFLRVDVSVPDSDRLGYRIPPDNPFIGRALPEIWSFGWRNPWRFSFDDPAFGGTGALIVGDVGQGAWEEVDYEPRNRGGRDYGWPIREGSHPNVTDAPVAFNMPLVDPIHEYPRTSGSSITGGFVYRGRLMGAPYRGRYFFADFISGRVWSIALTLNAAGEATAAGLVEHTAELGGTATLGNISSFGVDAAGELYIVSYSRGAVLQITGRPPAPPRNLRIVR